MEEVCLKCGTGREPLTCHLCETNPQGRAVVLVLSVPPAPSPSIGVRFLWEPVRAALGGTRAPRHRTAALTRGAAIQSHGNGGRGWPCMRMAYHGPRAASAAVQTVVRGPGGAVDAADSPAIQSHGRTLAGRGPLAACFRVRKIQSRLLTYNGSDSWLASAALVRRGGRYRALLLSPLLNSFHNTGNFLIESPHLCARSLSTCPRRPATRSSRCVPRRPRITAS